MSAIFNPILTNRHFNMNKFGIIAATLALSAAFPCAIDAQTILSLDECHEMAVRNNKELEQAGIESELAEYDRKIARANYYPSISAMGSYMYRTNEIALVTDEESTMLQNLGTLMQSGLPEGIDVSAMLNQLGTQLDEALHLDNHHSFIFGVSLQQPLFMGGKLINSNRIASLAEEMAHEQYEQKYEELLVSVDQAYWQIVSIAGKKRMAEEYAELLHNLERDAEISKREGVATASDALQVKVQANEADMLLTKASNALILAKMLLYKEIGLDLHSDITLADENLEEIPLPVLTEDKSLDEILGDRPEARSLNLATRIYEGKVKVARADMMPTVALTANYLFTNPNLTNGLESNFGGLFTVGATVSVPIFHGFEALLKTRRAKTEARIYQSKYLDACDKIGLEVTQLRQQRDEAYEKLTMAKSNLESAQENLRTATLGFENGVVDANTALSAHTAWLQAQSELIDAGIEIQMNAVSLRKAEAR